MTIRNVSKLLLTPRYYRRYQQVVRVLARHGFGEAMRRIRIWECVNIESRLLKREVCEFPHIDPPRRLRMALEELGPTFVKLGQLLSTRPDIVPAEYVAELRYLQRSVMFVPTESIREVIRAELGKPVDDVFQNFEEKPFAAASLAQVHRAELNGKPVALKVQRPGIVDMIEVDLEILKSVAELLERSAEINLLNPSGIVDEFTHNLRRELDFKAEAFNARRFANNFKGDETIRVPAVYLEYCTRKLVTMEFLDGIQVSDRQALVRGGYDVDLVARRGVVIGYKAIFQFGFFHADPHAGNILVLPGNVIGLLDYGMMATMSGRDRERLAMLIYSIAKKDEQRVARSLNELMESEDKVTSEDLEPAVTEIIAEYGDLPVSEMQTASMLFALMRAVLSHHGRFRQQLVWLAKSIAVEEDIARSLGAGYNVLEMGKPFAEKSMKQRLIPRGQPLDALFWVADWIDLVKDLPHEAGVVIHQLRKGLVKIEFEHVGLEPTQRTITQAANRLSQSLVVAALLVSSSIIILARIPPFVGETSVLGLVGLILSLVFGAVLIYQWLFRN